MDVYCLLKEMASVLIREDTMDISLTTIEQLTSHVLSRLSLQRPEANLVARVCLPAL